jgi:cytochrome c
MTSSSFETNKIVASVLVALMVAMVSGLLADILVRPMLLAKPAYVIAVPEKAEASAAGAAGAEPAGPEPIGPLMASASADAGKEIAAKCAMCHTFEKGGPNRVGPNLFGVVDEPIGQGRDGYSFSDGLKSKGGNWTVAELDQWLWKPTSFAKGTKMTFVGLPKAHDRADIVAYLNSLSDKPKTAAELAAEDPGPAPAAPGAGATPAAAPQPAKPAAPAAAPAAPAPAAPAPAAGQAPAAPAAGQATQPKP